MHGPLTQAETERAVRIDADSGYVFAERALRIAKAAPELTPEQREKLALLLQPHA